MCQGGLAIAVAHGLSFDRVTCSAEALLTQSWGPSLSPLLFLASPASPHHHRCADSCCFKLCPPSQVSMGCLVCSLLWCSFGSLGLPAPTVICSCCLPLLCCWYDGHQAELRACTLVGSNATQGASSLMTSQGVHTQSPLTVDMMECKDDFGANAMEPLQPREGLQVASILL